MKQIKFEGEGTWDVKDVHLPSSGLTTEFMSLECVSQQKPSGWDCGFFALQKKKIVVVIWDFYFIVSLEKKLLFCPLTYTRVFEVNFHSLPASILLLAMLAPLDSKLLPISRATT